MLTFLLYIFPVSFSSFSLSFLASPINYIILKKKKETLFCKQFSHKNISWTFSPVTQHEKIICNSIDFSFNSQDLVFLLSPSSVNILVPSNCSWLCTVLYWMFHICCNYSVACFKAFDSLNQTALHKGCTSVS